MSVANKLFLFCRRPLRPIRIFSHPLRSTEGRRKIHPVKYAARSSCAGFNRARTFIQFSPGDLPGEKASWPTAIKNFRGAEGKSLDCRVCSPKDLNRPCLCLPSVKRSGRYIFLTLLSCRYLTSDVRSPQAYGQTLACRRHGSLCCGEVPR